MDSCHYRRVRLALFFVAVLSGTVFSVRAASDIEGVASNSPSAQGQTTYLDYREVNYSLGSWTVPIVAQSTPFKKEPAMERGKLLRGSFRFGSDNSNSVAFVWERAAGKLYLDLNRNLDLTDDPAGVFVKRKRSAPNYAAFTNIHLLFKTASGNRQFLADLNLWDDGRRHSCSAALHSLWQSKMILGGREWEVGIVGNPFDGSLRSRTSRYLLLRPWSARDEPFSTDSETLETFPLPQKLFFHNHAYQLDCTDASEGDKSRLKLRFSEEHPAFGELKITGDSVQRAILQDGPYLVVIDQPESVVKVPVGKYNQPEVLLKQGEIQAYHDSSPLQQRKWIMIDEKRPAELQVGGPLTNSVSLNRRGRQLDLDYRLVGAGGEVYHLVRQDRTKPPEFAIYKGSKKIASGKFEFG
jgi:hypothetical protein